MALKLGSFSGSPLNLDDFTTGEKRGVFLNKKTSAQQAATTAILAGSSYNDFRTFRDDISHPESRERFLEENARLRDIAWQDAKKSMEGVLLDPEIDDETKLNVVNAPDKPPVGVFDSTLSMLGKKAAVADSEGETPTQSELRGAALDTIDSAIQYKREMQKVVNALKIERDGSAGSKLWDVAELMAPFAEWIHYSKLKSELGVEDEGAFQHLLGKQKRAIFDHFRGSSLEERAEFLEWVVDTISNSDQVIMPDGNDLVAIEALEQMLDDGDYSNLEYWVDNLTSVLDAAFGLGTVIRLGPKLLKGVNKASKATKGKKAPKGKKGLDGEILDPEPQTPPDNAGLLDEGFIIDGEATEVTIELDALAHTTRTDASPASVAKVVADNNPEQAREINKLVSDPKNGDEAAEATHGTTRTEALADDELPQAGPDGSIPHAVDHNTPHFDESGSLKKLRSSSGHLELTDDELTRITNNVVASFRAVEGFVLHRGQINHVTTEDGFLKINALYRPLNGAYSSADQAIENAKFALRGTQVAEDDLDVYVKAATPGKWVKISKDEARNLDASGVRNQYAIGVDYEYNFSPESIDTLELLTTGTGPISRFINLLDRIPTQFLAKTGQGSLVQNLFDPHSHQALRIANAASVAVDKTYAIKAAYVSLFKEAAKMYEKLKGPRRDLVRAYIEEANFQGLPHNVTDLVNRGFTQEEIDILNKWRYANDMMWYPANQDMIVTLRRQGYKTLDHAGSDTRLVGKPVALQNVKANAKVYDPKDNVNKDFGVVKQDLDNVSGQVIQFGEPVEINGEWVSYAISWENPYDGFLRNIADNEPVLAYRQGYYPVSYDTNFFIEKVIKRPDGTSFKKVIATARDSSEINNFKRMIMEAEGLSEEEYNTIYSFRKDRRLTRDRNAMFDEGSWNLASSSNMTTQRVRGKRLADAGINLHLMGKSNLKDPMEAVAESIQSLSVRIPMRDYFDATKKRWLDNYGKYLDLPTNKISGNKEFPSSIAQVKGLSFASGKIVAQARTFYNYIYSLENGYINGIDELYKGSLHVASEMFSELGAFKGERAALKLQGYSPAHASKSLAFKLFISSNPPRQAVIQRGQLLMMPAANPEYFLKGGMTKDLLGIRDAQARVGASQHYKDLLEEIRSLGILEAVDSHTLIRTDSLSLADIKFVPKMVNGTKKWTIDLLQQVGFDLAEQDVLMGAYLTFRDRALRAGKNIKDIRVREGVLAEARAFTLNMNRSGDFAYTQNTLSIPAQFLSFRHKAMLQQISNKSLTPKQRAGIAAYSALVFGVPASIITYAYGPLVDEHAPSDLKDAINDGLIDVAINSSLAMISGEEQNISFRDLAPTEAWNAWNVISAMLEGSMVDLISESPAGSLVFGGNPRLLDAVQSVVRLFKPLDYQTEGLDTSPKDVVLAAAHSFSGFSTLWKANYAMRTGQLMSTSSGRILAEDLTFWESLALAFGLQPKDAEGNRRFFEKMYEGSDNKGAFFIEDDVKAWYAELKRHLARKNLSVAEKKYHDAILAEGWRVFELDRPRAMETVRSLIQRDLASRDGTIINSFWNQTGLKTDAQMWELINKLPDNDLRRSLVEGMNTKDKILNDPIWK